MQGAHSLSVQLAHFEGPLALLLYLIRKDEMDIMDIKIHEITAQYLEYIKLMKELDIELASDFISMAATLIQIKSRMLLPQYDENGEIVETEDPRKELVQKLLEYQKYQEAAKLLGDRPWVGRDVFLRGTRERLDMQEEEIELEENALFSLITAYRKALKGAKKRIHKVAAKTQSIAQRIMQMSERLIAGVRIRMTDLYMEAELTTREVLITFLSLLELGKMGFVQIAQNEPYSDIWILTKKPIEEAAVSRVEEYDNLHSTDNLNRLIAESEAEAGAPAEGEQQEFLLTDAEDRTLEVGDGRTGDDFVSGLQEEITEDMASDDEIEAAEAELKAARDAESAAAIAAFDADNSETPAEDHSTETQNTEHVAYEPEEPIDGQQEA